MVWINKLMNFNLIKINDLRLIIVFPISFIYYLFLTNEG